MKAWPIFCLFLGAVLGLSERVKRNVRGNFGNANVFTFKESDMRRVMELLDENVLDEVGHFQDKVHLKVSPGSGVVLTKAGIEFVDVTETFLSNVERVLNEDMVCEDDFIQCAIRVPDEFYSRYQRYEVLHERFLRFARAQPEVATWETLGLSFEGREQKVLMISDDGEKPMIFYFCAIHAREWITPMFCTYMAETLLDTSNPHSRHLLSLYTFAIMPVSNPDGYVYTHEVDNFWRKTRKPNVGSDCIGTDPNRNYAVGFGGEGASSDPCSNTYHGVTPFDQEITKNIKAFTDSHQARLIHINDVHSHGGYWMSPYAGTFELPPAADWEQMDTCNKQVQKALNETSDIVFKVGPVASTIYIASGGAVDYFYEANGVVHSYTYEARSGGLQGLEGFQPPPFNIKISNHELYVGLLAAIECIEQFIDGPI